MVNIILLTIYLKTNVFTHIIRHASVLEITLNLHAI